MKRDQTPIMIKSAHIDGKNVKMQLKTRFFLLAGIKQRLKERYGAKVVNFTYYERRKNVT